MYSARAHPQGAVAIEQAGQLLVRQAGQQLCQARPTVLVHVAEHVLAGFRPADKDDAPVAFVVVADDERPSLEPGDDPGHARFGDVHRVGEVAHGDRLLGLERRQHCQMDHAERSLVHLAEREDHLARIPRLSSAVSSSMSWVRLDARPPDGCLPGEYSTSR